VQIRPVHRSVILVESVQCAVSRFVPRMSGGFWKFIFELMGTDFANLHLRHCSGFGCLWSPMGSHNMPKYARTNRWNVLKCHLLPAALQLFQGWKRRSWLKGVWNLWTQGQKDMQWNEWCSWYTSYTYYQLLWYHIVSMMRLADDSW
jgi:hypothetical protein